MLLNFIDRVGEWNPQLFRELKGRLKPFNVVIAVASSLLLQLVVFLFQLREFPDDKYSLMASYCTLRQGYQNQEQQLYQQQNLLQQKIDNYRQIKLSDNTIIPNLETQIEQVNTEINNLRSYLSQNICPPDQINWQLWWRDHWEYYFLAFSVIFVFTLLVAGTYLLISDLAKEEQRGTLNFIRLSPQSETSILTGKMLGVPSLIYLFILTAIPLHFWAGHSANIASSYILSYYAILAGSGIFFYSAALLFGLVSRWFSSFQPWLGSGAVLLFLFMTMGIASSHSNEINNPLAWLRFFSPWDMTSYLFPNLFRVYKGSSLDNLQFFYFPIGQSVVSLVGIHLLNYGICTYGIWQAMKRCFKNPNTTILSKGQSYFFIAFSQLMFVGLSMQDITSNRDADFIGLVAVLNLALVFVLTAILSPHRQTVQDWARYRHQNHKNESLWQDLFSGEKSPAIMAIAINLAIAAIPLIVWISLIPEEDFNNSDFGKIKALLAVALSISLMMICATIAQLMLLMKNPKRHIWAIGTVAVVMFLPPIIFQVFGIYASESPTLWLFSTFPWSAIQYSGTVTIFMALLADFTVLALLNFQLTRKVRVLGESATKALLAGR
ncbi:ABC transporter permease subunit [Anabaena lutea]|uniref:ABC transporter permease n=1 Tax=Anabaena lutea FACHB-196 TaxID=2692881 RepID=A0ABR8F9W9_9NOST|nr:ABC transporter permease subunit [Anabaena lutea]MBD2566988.1 ABC transporter permease [Anabaena lutea FACHB-196]